MLKSLRPLTCALLVAPLLACSEGTEVGQTTSGLDVNIPSQSAAALDMSRADVEALAKTLSKDATFIRWMRLNMEIVEQMQAALDEMSRDQANAAVQALMELADSGATEAQVLARIAELTGVSQAKMNRAGTMANQIKQRYPVMGSAGPAMIGHATVTNPALLSQLSKIEIDTRTEEEKCIDACKEEREERARAAVMTYAAISVGCPFCMPAAGLWLIGELMDAANDEDNCIDICMGFFKEGECRDDDDCDPTEWCYRGPLGIGDNECRPDKDIPETCSRDEKCLTGCCTYDFWQHPVSNTCNPAADCN